MRYKEFVAINRSWFDTRHLKAINAVVKLHKPYSNDMACEECSVGDYSEPYPCPTIRAIKEAIK